jgi:hypothetical protein
MCHQGVTYEKQKIFHMLVHAETKKRTPPRWLHLRVLLVEGDNWTSRRVKNNCVFACWCMQRQEDLHLDDTVEGHLRKGTYMREDEEEEALPEQSL